MNEENIFLIKEDIKTLEDLKERNSKKLTMARIRFEQLSKTKESINDKLKHFRKMLIEEYYEKE